MPMTTGFDCDVLVVGAGPTGLTLALLLARHGLSVVIAEKDPGPYPLPRAAHIDHQIVGIFQELGLADAILVDCRQAARYDFLTAGGEVLMRLEGADQIGSGGWPIGNMIHQPSIERILREAVATSELVELHDSWEFTRLAEGADGISAWFDTEVGEQRLHARYMVGADGARSPVRAALGIAMDDLGFDEQWIVVDTLVRDASRLPTVNLQICDPQRPTTCVLMGAGRHRWEFMVKPGESADAIADDASIIRLLAPWNVEGAVEIERKAIYRFAAKLAQTWRRGRVAIAGDAAHRMPPFAGQGLCSGIRDAANLAWKLAAVIKGGAADALLDSYQPEREPNVRSIIGTAMMMGQMVCMTDPAEVAARNSAMLAARAAGRAPGSPPEYAAISEGCIMSGTNGAGSYFPQPVVESMRLDDILGPGPWLITQTSVARPPAADIAVHAVTDTALAPFAARLKPWFAAHATDAVLVRPDRHVFGTGAPDDLLVAWHNMVSAA